MVEAHRTYYRTAYREGTYNYNPLFRLAQAVSTKYFIFGYYAYILCKLHYVNK